MTYDKFCFNRAQNICFLLIRWVWMWNQQPRLKHSLIYNFNLFFYINSPIIIVEKRL
jgi:hypothetical protein